MRGRKRKGSRPNDILSRAVHMGLVALVRLASKRISEKTRKFYNSIEEMWETALSMKDFSAVQRAEPNMRGQFLKILWVSTRRFGNRESKRVYSWLKGTVGPLNALLNYAGARLRDLAMTRYPFPEPETFYIRKYPDGSRKVLTKKENELLGKDDAIKTYTRTGYRRRGKSPLVLLAHPTLPEMDFVDMIRAHMVELCRQCFIHNVPRSEAHKYIRLLIHRLRPFLDWVYSDGEHGRPNFNRYSDHELRQIVLEIRSLYGRRTGRRKSVTRTLDEDSEITSIEKFQKKVKKLHDAASDEKDREVYSNILDHIDSGMIVQRDLEKLVEQVLALSSREGNEWHRILLSDLHHPQSLKQAVYAGDTMLDEPSSVLIVGELPVSRRKGQIDLVVFLRREVQGRIIHTPVMILEVKTKTTFDYNLFGVSVNKDYVPSLYAWKRTSSEQEWIEVFTSPPAPRTLDQLDAYELELLHEYRQVAPFDPTQPKTLWKGVVVLDTDQRPLEVFEAFNSLLDDLVMGLVSDLLDTSKMTSYIMDSRGPRVAAILTPSEGPSELLNEACAPQSLPVEDPFRERVSDNRDLTLYVSVSSPTSSGNSAAWISRNWHLLHHIRECTEDSSDAKIFWVDMMGDYPGELLARRRFGLESLLAERSISKGQYQTLTRLLKKTRFVDLSTNVNELLSGESQGLERLIDNLDLSFQNLPGSESIIVIDGWSEFRDMVPSNRSHLIRSLETRLLEVLPDSHTNVIWIDNGVEHTRMNRHYQRKCIVPLSHDSPRRVHVDEIIYNIPTSSRGFGRLSPKRDDERFIVQDIPASVPPWRTSIYVPRLIEYSKRFKGGQGRRPTLDDEDVYDRELRAMYGRGVTLSNIRPYLSRSRRRHVSELEGFALSLVPSTLRPRDGQTEDQEEEEKAVNPPVHLLAHPVTGLHSNRLNLSPRAPPPKPNRADRAVYVDADEITRRWFYELAPPQVFDGVEDDENVVMRPPTIDSTDTSGIDSGKTRELELRRLHRTVRYLLKRSSSKDLINCYERIETICSESLSSDYTAKNLLHALEQVREIIIDDAERLQVWETVRPIRLGLLELLNTKNRKVLGEVLERSPDILLLYGNNLFLLVLAVMESVHKNVLHPHVIPLWQSVVEWELYQLGFKTQRDTVQSKYDLHSMYSNLMTRARTLPTLGLSDHALSPQQSGQMVWTGKEDNYAVWIIFQSEKGLVGGLVGNLPSKWLRPSYFRCVNDPQVLKDSASRALYSVGRNSIAVTEVGGHNVLWMQSEGEDGPVWSSSVIEHGKGPSVPWIRLREPYDIPALNDEVLAPPVLPLDIGEHVDDFLREVASVEKDVTQVTCVVSINVEKNLYEVEFKDHSRETLLCTLLFRNTSELVETLRHPVRRGTPLRIKKKSLVMWDHQKDIQYTGCELVRGETREVISVSLLKPLVYRSRFHPDEYKYPETCGELLSTTSGKRITLVIQPEDNNTYRVRLQGISAKSSLKSLEGLELNVFDMVLLAECEQLIDTTRKTRHEVVIDARQLSDFRFSQLNSYPRLREAVSHLVETGFNWYTGLWDIEVSEAQDGSDVVFWTIRSVKTGRVWMGRSFSFILDYGKRLAEHIRVFKETVSKTIPLEHISRFSETLREFERILRSKGLGDGKPRCRLDSDVRDGKDVAVVKMVESNREIDSFPIETDDLEQLEELMIADGGPLTYYEVVNLDEFYDHVRRVTSTDRKESESDEDADLLTVIREYREEGDKRGLGHSLMLLAREKLSEGMTGEAEVAVDEALILLRECDQNNRLVRSDLAGALAVQVEILIILDRELEVARGLLDEARELVWSLLETLRAGQTDVTVQRTGKSIDRLLQWLDES